jgi:hypothetical protein
MKDDPMPSIIDQLTEIYVFIDDHLKQHPEKAQWRGSNNAEPDFSDAEVLTIGLSQSALGVQSLKEAYEKIRDNHQAAFPHLPSYKVINTTATPASCRISKVKSAFPPDRCGFGLL